MGVTNSSLKGLKDNNLLKKFASKEHIASTDANFWKQFLSFAFTSPPQTWNEARLLDESLTPLLESLSENNLTSHNVGSLVRVFLETQAQLKEINAESTSDTSAYNLQIWRTFNSIYILKTIAKHFIQTFNEENLVKQFEALLDSPPSGTSADGKPRDPGDVMIELLMNALTEIIVDIPLDNATYNLHVEAINGLIVLLSVQMYSPKPASKSSIFRNVMRRKCAIHAILFTKNLLTNYARQPPPPTGDGGSLILGLASGFWNVLTLGYGKQEVDENLRSPLARQSLILLLILTNHCTAEKNPYRDALFNCSDSQVEKGSGDQVSSFKIEYGKLYSTICEHLSEEPTTLLLYSLLHRNDSFRTFVLSRAADLDQLLIPILKVLYSSPERDSHHIYMALIVLLILSEDNLFNQSVHDISLKNVMWYTERNLTQISLGSLIVLVIIRTIQYNIIRTRDKFLHTNLLATLANMSSEFKQLHPYVCQRLVSLFERLSKKLNKTLGTLNENQRPGNNETPSNGLDSSLSSDQATSDVETETASVCADLMHDLSIYEEVLRMVLEILNSCLSSQLSQNPDLIYTLLYKRHVFVAFQSHPAFQDVVINLETVLTYFANRIQEHDSPSVEEVRSIIQMASLQWPSDRLKKFPELRFRYVEDEKPEEFFIPYIWSLVYRLSQIYWNSQNIYLFNPNPNVI